jgi:outer membrane immunogenic protein
MMRLSFATTMLSLNMGGYVFAADLPVSKPLPVYMQPPLFTWSGVYLGGQIGVGFGTDKANLPGYTAAYNPDGYVGGAHVGFNHQFNQTVIGVEADIEGSSVSQTYVDTPTAIIFTTKLPVQGSVRGRIGWAWDKILFYATGGAAFANSETGYSGAFGTYSYTRPLSGWTVGAGGECALNANWSFRAEYRYADLGHESNLVAGNLQVDHHVLEHSLRIGFSYKFDSLVPAAPVVAKY